MLLGTFLLLSNQTEDNMEPGMLREIAHDKLTPKKSNKIESAQDFYERLVDEDDLLYPEVESYEVITEYR